MKSERKAWFHWICRQLDSAILINVTRNLLHEAAQAGPDGVDKDDFLRQTNTGAGFFLEEELFNQLVEQLELCGEIRHSETHVWRDYPVKQTP